MKYKIYIIFVVLVFASCKITRTIPVAQKKTNQVAALIATVQQAQPQFSTANVNKMTLALEMGERKVNVSATCKIRKDSAIYVSIQPFMGIELFKAELTRDSLHVYDKMNNRYYALDYAYFSKRFGVNVDFNSLQALLFGQFFCIGSNNIVADSCTLSEQNKIEYQHANMMQTTEIAVDNTIKQVSLKAKNSTYQLQTNYENYTKQDSVSFPQKIVFMAFNEKTKASCNFEILRVQFNSVLKFTPTSTARFTKGDIEQLLNK